MLIDTADHYSTGSDRQIKPVNQARYTSHEEVALMTTRPTRRNFLTGAGALGLSVPALAALSACASGGGDQPEPTSDGEVDDADGPAVLQNWRADRELDGLQAVVGAFNDEGSSEIEINSIPVETYRVQLPSYLSAQNPPDVYTWLAGSATRAYADAGLLLDVSDVWADMDSYSDALRELSTDSAGNQVFVPMSYYWWGLYYRPSVFDELEVSPPETWQDFLDISESIQEQGVTPIGSGLSDAAWMSAAWFDYLNLRVNGGQYHLELLAGEHSFDSDEVRAVLAAWRELLPYFDPNVLGLTSQQAMTNFAQGRSAMFLAGSFLQDAVPADILDDLDFVSFPEIDSAIPRVEEAPTDGFFASSQTTRPNAVKDFLAFSATAQAQELMLGALGPRQLATNPDADVELDRLAQTGKDMLDSADQLTQFFNRDASDALQPTADAALTRFIDQPDDVDAILGEWERAARQVFDSQ